MRVIEIFEAFQGEGQFIGQRSIFVRFFGCNMRCSWCDTAYAINRKEWQSSEESIRALTVEQLMERITSESAGSVVLTGGEPTIQPQLAQLLQELYGVGYLTTIETNASIIPDGLKEWYGESWHKSGVLWSLSPKLLSAGTGTGRVWIDHAVVQWFVAQTRSQLKFVIADRIDILAALRLVQSLQFEPTRVPIILQPEGSTVDLGASEYFSHLRSLQRELDPGWEPYDIRVLPQLHILLHGRKKRCV